jgi:hypothetical protein
MSEQAREDHTGKVCIYGETVYKVLHHPMQYCFHVPKVDQQPFKKAALIFISCHSRYPSQDLSFCPSSCAFSHFK